MKCPIHTARESLLHPLLGSGALRPLANRRAVDRLACRSTMPQGAPLRLKRSGLPIERFPGRSKFQHKDPE